MQSISQAHRYHADIIGISCPVHTASKFHNAYVTSTFNPTAVECQKTLKVRCNSVHLFRGIFKCSTLRRIARHSNGNTWYFRLSETQMICKLTGKIGLKTFSSASFKINLINDRCGSFVVAIHNS